MTSDSSNRRKFPRLNGPLYFREARLLGETRQLIDVSAGGARVLTDEKVVEGARLELSLFQPDGTSLEAIARVAWVNRLEKGSPAQYEVGLEFLEMNREMIARLRSILGPAED